jgi:hypothetical protein
MKLYLLIAFLTLSLFSLYGAESDDSSPYHRHTVESIAYQVKGEMTIASLTLNNGTIWNASISPMQEYLLSDIEKYLSPPTEIYFYPVLGYDAFYIARYEDELLKGASFGMAKNTKELLPRIIEMKKNEGGWIFAAPYPYEFTLSDNSKWRVRINTGYKTNALAKWKVGDPIIASRYAKSKKILMINVNAPSELDQKLLGSYEGKWDARLFPYFEYEELEMVQPPS